MIPGVCRICGHPHDGPIRPVVGANVLFWNQSFVRITNLEKALLKVFVKNMPNPVGSEMLIHAGWGRTEPNKWAFTMAISGIRKTINPLNLSIVYSPWRRYALVEGRPIQRSSYARPIALERILAIEECYKKGFTNSKTRIRTGETWATVRRYYKIFRENPEWQLNYPISVSSSSLIRASQSSTVT